MNTVRVRNLLRELQKRDWSCKWRAKKNQQSQPMSPKASTIPEMIPSTHLPIAKGAIAWAVINKAISYCFPPASHWFPPVAPPACALQSRTAASQQCCHPCSAGPAWRGLSLLHEAGASRAKQLIPGTLYRLSTEPNLRVFPGIGSEMESQHSLHFEEFWRRRGHSTTGDGREQISPQDLRAGKGRGTGGQCSSHGGK